MPNKPFEISALKFDRGAISSPTAPFQAACPSGGRLKECTCQIGIADSPAFMMAAVAGDGT